MGSDSCRFKRHKAFCNRSIIDSIEQLNREIKGRFQAHPDAEIFDSFPSAGAAMAPGDKIQSGIKNQDNDFPHAVLRVGWNRRKVVVRAYLEDLEHLIEQFPVLSGNAHLHLELGGAVAQVQDHGTQLDGFRTRAENE
jgi:hypothetical protein